MRESNQAFYRTAENRIYPYEGFYCNYHTLIVVHLDPRSLQQFRTRFAGGDTIRVARQSWANRSLFDCRNIKATSVPNERTKLKKPFSPWFQRYFIFLHDSQKHLNCNFYNDSDPFTL